MNEVKPEETVLLEKIEARNSKILNVTRKIETQTRSLKSLSTKRSYNRELVDRWNGENARDTQKLTELLSSKETRAIDG